jgi:hypothetical protein
LWEKKLELATVIGQDFEGNLESMILGMIEWIVLEFAGNRHELVGRLTETFYG